MKHLEAKKIEWFRCQLTTWSAENLRDFPWRRTRDPYPIFVAEFLLQKTNAANVLPVWEAFLDRYSNLKTLATAPVEEVARIMQPLGLFFRAERLCQSAQLIEKNYGGKIPATEAELLELPGVGIYTARSVCTHAFGQPVAVLDANVARILERFFGLKGTRVKSRCKLLWSAAERIAPDKETSRWNLILLDFGAVACTARNPRCHECPLQEQCNFFNFSLRQKEQ
ncbi:MAG: A/G-specific adenine glycosylase [Hormoscilla sp. GUM202]|nr:A/G-specific adenine glycosylase [Hormoscilla sp. GUM202]